MQRRIISSLYIALWILVAPSELEGQPRTWIYSAEAEKIFAKGLEAYREGRFDMSVARLQRLLEFPQNQRSSAGQLLLGKSYFRLSRFAESLDVARGLERKFADSRYLPDARLLAGDSYFKLKRYYESASQYGRLLATAARLDIQAQAAERLAAITKNGYLNTQGLENLALAIGAKRLREALFFGQARWYGRLGWKVETDRAMQTYRDSISGGIFAQLADPNRESFIGESADLSEGPVTRPRENSVYEPDPVAELRTDLPRLGLLLPMTGPYRPIGEELLAGVQLANWEAGSIFELIVADTGVDYGDLPIGHRGGDVSESPSSGLLRVVHGTRELIAEGVVAIVGPVFSTSSIAAAVVAEHAGVPLLVPLSQQSGLDPLGRHIFQLRSIPETQGRILGEYATLALGFEHIAMVSPLSDYGWGFEREFSHVVESNGGEIVYSDWYVPNQTKDFRRVFEEIRAVGFELMPPPEDSLGVADILGWTSPDSLLVEEEPSFLTELLRGLEEEPTPEIDEPEEASPDSSEIFIDTIDAIVVVVESFEDAKTIAPQVHFHRLETQVLGNDIWHDSEAIRQMRPGERKDLDGAIFVSARLEGAVVAREFIDAFRKRFHNEPEYAASGYDGARLLIEGWKEGYREPSELTAWLAGIGFYEGASGIISLSSGAGPKAELSLFKIDRGKIRSLGDRDLPEMKPIEEDFSLPGLDLPEDDLPLDELE